MSKQKIELIYDIVIQGYPLTKLILLKENFTESEINIMLEDGILVPDGIDKYQLYTLYDLYYYGLKLLSAKEFKKANKCFNRCYQLDSKNRTFNLQLFLKSLKIQDYKSALERFSRIEKIESETYESDNNLYLYLLNMITSCGKQYEERLYNMDYDSLLLPASSNEYYKQEMNNIRHLIMKYKYRKALELTNHMIKKSNCVELEILKELIEQVINKEKAFKLLLLEYAEEHKYQKIYSLLKEISQKRYLSNADTYIYLISKAIIDLVHTGVIQEVTIKDTTCIYEAIKGNNFDVAKQINDIMMQKKPPLDNQIIDILLSDINRLIIRLQIEQTNQTTKNIPIKNYIKEIEEKAYYLQSENISFEEASQQINLTTEDILMIKLIYARDYYTEEMYLLGDILVKEVEKSKTKTTRVIQLLNEVQANKKFYKNRIDSYTRKISQNQK